MSLRQRRLLFIFFIILFLVAVPAVLLYATGQRINWRRFEFEKTSALIVDSNPTDAVVLLNGNPSASSFPIPLGQPAKTKTKISSLAPGEYAVRLEKEGFWPWQETIKLNPGEAVNLGTVRLFRNEAPTRIAADTALADQAIFSPSHQRLLLLARDAAGSIDLENPAERFSFAVPLDPKTAITRWSASENKVAIGSRFLDLTDGRMINLGQATGRNASQLRWDTENDDYLYFIDSGSLRRFTVSRMTEEPAAALSPLIKNRRFIDYYVRGRTLYIIAEEAVHRQTLIVVSLPATIETSISLPAGSYRFGTAVANQPTLFDATQQSVYLIEEPAPLLRRYRISNVVDDYSTGRWINADLAYATPFELRYWSKDSGQSTLLTRLGTAVTAIESLPTAGYIAYSTADSITLLGIRPDPFMNPLEVIRAETIKAIAERDNDNLLYFYGRYNSENGLFRISL